jgi:sarcosine oxidase
MFQNRGMTTDPSSTIATADVIVIGLGAFGSAAAWQLAKAGAKVIGIDRHAPPHDLGSSHGATRITRLAVAEGDAYVPLVRRAHEIWGELEAATGETLYTPTGGLIIGPREAALHGAGRPSFLRRTMDAAARFGIPHELLTAADTTARFPQFELKDDELAYFEPSSGVLRPERCIAAQLGQARAHGACLRLGETVLAIDSHAAGVTVTTDRGVVSAAKAIVTAGPWIPGLVGGAFARHLRVMRQVLYWFETSRPELYRPDASPVFIWMHGDASEEPMYGFPMIDGHAGVKVATEQYVVSTDPDRMERRVSEAEQRLMFDHHLAGRLRAITPRCVHSAACLYTVSTDSHFIIDRHPEHPHVSVASACSGHGFKHSAAVGEALARQALGERVDVLSSFGLARFDR